MERKERRGDRVKERLEGEKEERDVEKRRRIGLEEKE